LLFSLVAYAIFFLTFLYLVAFTANLPWVPVTVDRGPATPVGIAIIIDIGLIALFGVQHSVMARQGFKRAWTRVVPKSVERSVYVLAASLVLIALFALWRPIDGMVWRASAPALRIALWTLFAGGWLLVLLSTFLLNHFELFGLSQTWRNLRRQGEMAPAFRTPLFYRIVRHPLYAGFFIAFWATPDMSMGHLLLAVGMSAYMLIAIPIEERDMIDAFGATYGDYQQKVGGLVPRFGRGIR